jgi:hypothetical protein
LGDRDDTGRSECQQPESPCSKERNPKNAIDTRPRNGEGGESFSFSLFRFEEGMQFDRLFFKWREVEIFSVEKSSRVFGFQLAHRVVDARNEIVALERLKKRFEQKSTV